MTLFLIASGLSLIFGVLRVLNFAHGSFYMLGLYGAVALTSTFAAGPLGWWAGVLLAALAVAALGALGSGVAYLLYFALIASAGASRAILVTYLVPAFALVYGAALLDEPVTSIALTGLGLVLAGTALATGLVRRHSVTVPR